MLSARLHYAIVFKPASPLLRPPSRSVADVARPRCTLPALPPPPPLPDALSLLCPDNDPVPAPKLPAVHTPVRPPRPDQLVPVPDTVDGPPPPASARERVGTRTNGVLRARVGYCAREWDAPRAGSGHRCWVLRPPRPDQWTHDGSSRLYAIVFIPGSPPLRPPSLFARPRPCRSSPPPLPAALPVRVLCADNDPALVPAPKLPAVHTPVRPPRPDQLVPVLPPPPPSPPAPTPDAHLNGFSATVMGRRTRSRKRAFCSRSFLQMSSKSGIVFIRAPEPGLPVIRRAPPAPADRGLLRAPLPHTPGAPGDVPTRMPKFVSSGGRACPAL